MSTEADTTPTHTPEQAIALLAKNADMIEQTASNLEKAVVHLGSTQKLKLRQYEVVKDRSGYNYELKRRGSFVTVYDDRSNPVRDQSSLHWEGVKRADIELAQLVSDLNEVGVLTHKVHLDKKVLTTKESEILEHLPEKLAEARAAMQEVIDHSGSLEGEKLAEITQYKRDVKFLDKLGKDIGNAGTVMVEHNNQLIDRQSDLRTEEEMDADRMARFKQGVAYLDESDKHARQFNPSYRERVKSRKEIPELKVLEDTPENSR